MKPWSRFSKPEPYTEKPFTPLLAKLVLSKYVYANVVKSSVSIMVTKAGG